MITRSGTFPRQVHWTIADRLPEEALDALVSLASGERPEPRRQTELPLDPFAHPDAQRRFWVAADERQLQQALDYPWDEWMIFLHPAQQNAVERSFAGPARLTGAAGTGKTVVALHRAVHLAKGAPEAQILLTTYSRILARRLEQGLDKLVGSTGDLRRRIKVQHLHQLAFELAGQEAEFAFDPLRPSDLEGFIASALDEHRDSEATADFLRAEFDAVIDYWGIKDLTAYLEVSRQGRGSALNPTQRTQLWPVIEAVLARVAANGKMTWADLASHAGALIEKRQTQPFTHVVVDEAQDFGPRELKLLLALAPIGPESHFFAGDTGQRIYRYPFSWLRVGLDLRGRATRLTVNYRTTRQIKAFADQVLGQVEGLDEEEVSDRSAASLLSGPDPLVLAYANAAEESEALAEWLKDLVQSGLAPDEIALFARTSTTLEDSGLPAVERAGLDARILGRSEGGEGEAAVALGSLHMAKGLEFRAVALLGCTADKLPHPSALSAADSADARAIALARERQLFYVGCTRARDLLRISFVGEPSPFLDALLQDKSADR